MFKRLNLALKITVYRAIRTVTCICLMLLVCISRPEIAVYAFVSRRRQSINTRAARLRVKHFINVLTSADVFCRQVPCTQRVSGVQLGGALAGRPTR